mmetsp:Transcript_13128/g.49075  ORF Transcript_13128/g.49075 Transcript_13128/m.49075 type:complete len:297 (+) Transcript_13128:4508-5398(+)
MRMRKSLPRNSAWFLPRCVNTPPNFMIRSASVTRSVGASLASFPLTFDSTVPGSFVCVLASSIVSHASGLSCALRLIPEKCPPSCRMETTCFHCSSSSSHSSLVCSFAVPPPAVDSSLSAVVPAPSVKLPATTASPPPFSNRFPSRNERACKTRQMFNSSWSRCGVFSLACFRGRREVHLARSARRGACVTRIFIFCFGVRSPCRITANTARSSSDCFRFGFAPGVRGAVCASPSPSSHSSLSSSFVCSSASKAASAVRRWSGATARKIIARKHKLASSKYFTLFFTKLHPLTSQT